MFKFFILGIFSFLATRCAPSSTESSVSCVRSSSDRGCQNQSESSENSDLYLFSAGGENSSLHFEAVAVGCGDKFKLYLSAGELCFVDVDASWKYIGDDPELAELDVLMRFAIYAEDVGFLEAKIDVSSGNVAFVSEKMADFANQQRNEETYVEGIKDLTYWPLSQSRQEKDNDYFRTWKEDPWLFCESAPSQASFHAFFKQFDNGLRKPFKESCLLQLAPPSEQQNE